jgi:uncharacterized protein (DUF488 family)
MSNKGSKKQSSADTAPAAAVRLYTIGHSNHDWSTFVEVLRDAGVAVLADVRSSPYSRRMPHFSRPELARGLRAEGIAYLFLGDLLGGRPPERELYDDEGRVDYERVRRTAEFRHGLDRLTRDLPVPAVLMCAEEDPLDCHRGLMIAPALCERGLRPVHLRKVGPAESTAEMEARLLRLTGVGAGLLGGLFADALTDDDHRQLLAEAYRRRARLKAYRLDGGAR